MRTRDRILEAARTLFNDEGLAQVSTNRIATELDISPGNLHYHFKKKEDLVGWLLRRFTEALRPFADSHESVEVIEDLWMTIHLALEVIDQYRFILRDADYLVREYPTLVLPLRELIGRRIAAIRAVLEKLRDLEVIQVTDEQLTALVLQAVLVTTAWHAFENLMPVAARGPISGTRAAAYHLLVMLSPYVNDASRLYLDYLRDRYAG